MLNKKIKIVLTGGGTGGHITPLIAVFRELKHLNPALQFIYIGPTRNSRGQFKKDNIKVWPLFTGRFRRYITLKSVLLNIIDIFKILFGFLQSLLYLIIYKPTIIFSKGGYGSFPTIVWAWIFRIPIVAHESDSIPGATNRLLARFATKVAVSFPGEYSKFPAEKIVVLGTPLRNMQNMGAKEAEKLLNIKGEKPLVFITGASQGAEQINRLVFKNLENLLKKYEIIHQVGDKNYKIIQQKIKRLSLYTKDYHVYPFLDEEEMKAAYVASNLVISRASSTNLFEIAVLGKPSILIPLPTSAAGHQLKNAEIYEKAGACINLNPFNITPSKFYKILSETMRNHEKLESMSLAAKKFSKPKAAANVAELILKIINA